MHANPGRRDGRRRPRRTPFRAASSRFASQSAQLRVALADQQSRSAGVNSGSSSKLVAIASRSPCARREHLGESPLGLAGEHRARNQEARAAHSSEQAVEEAELLRPASRAPSDSAFELADRNMARVSCWLDAGSAVAARRRAAGAPATGQQSWPPPRSSSRSRRARRHARSGRQRAARLCAARARRAVGRRLVGRDARSS